MAFLRDGDATRLIRRLMERQPLTEQFERTWHEDYSFACNDQEHGQLSLIYSAMRFPHQSKLVTTLELPFSGSVIFGEIKAVKNPANPVEFTGVADYQTAGRNYVLTAGMFASDGEHERMSLPSSTMLDNICQGAAQLIEESAKSPEAFRSFPNGFGLGMTILYGKILRYVASLPE